MKRRLWAPLAILAAIGLALCFISTALAIPAPSAPHSRFAEGQPS